MKEVTHIDCPKEWEATDDFSSHRPALWLALENTEGAVVEMGSGFGSTPLIEKYCCEFRGRKFRSYETNKEWAEKVGATYIDKYLDGNEALCGRLLKNLLNIGVLFVDCAPADIRKDIIGDYSTIANIIVAHDTEIGSHYVYGMEDILNKFKYRLDYKPEGNPATTIVSNFINVENWV